MAIHTTKFPGGGAGMVSHVIFRHKFFKGRRTIRGVFFVFAICQLSFSSISRKASMRVLAEAAGSLSSAESSMKRVWKPASFMLFSRGGKSRYSQDSQNFSSEENESARAAFFHQFEESGDPPVGCIVESGARKMVR